VTINTSTIPGVDDFTGNTATTLNSDGSPQIACGFLGQVLVVAIARLKQRLAPDVVLARGAVEMFGQTSGTLRAPGTRRG